jgi:hypothetical protein
MSADDHCHHCCHHDCVDARHHQRRGKRRRNSASILCVNCCDVLLFLLQVDCLCKRFSEACCYQATLHYLHSAVKSVPVQRLGPSQCCSCDSILQHKHMPQLLPCQGVSFDALVTYLVVLHTCAAGRPTASDTGAANIPEQPGQHPRLLSEALNFSVASQKLHCEVLTFRLARVELHGEVWRWSMCSSSQEQLVTAHLAEVEKQHQRHV